MTDKFKAIQAIQVDDRLDIALREIDQESLSQGDVIVKVAYSTINYKDGLALLGNQGRVMRTLPMIPGIDFSGTVESSDHHDFNVGDEVIMTGWGIGESHTGGLSQKARVNGDWLIKLPEGFDHKDAMSIGTAGFTAMLCVMALEANGVEPSRGQILVTGAGGGVGSIAVAVLSFLGFEVVASTRRSEIHDYLLDLGASEIISSDIFNSVSRPLMPEQWAGVIDAVGGNILGALIPSVKYWGCIALCGNAGGINFSSNVLPFILRGIKLQGVESVYTPKHTRKIAWDRLVDNLSKSKLKEVTNVVNISEVFDVAKQILEGNIKGRTVVDVNNY
jgi:acrylyl-CoA reductase (NADPH)